MTTFLSFGISAAAASTSETSSISTPLRSISVQSAVKIFPQSRIT